MKTRKFLEVFHSPVRDTVQIIDKDGRCVLQVDADEVDIDLDSATDDELFDYMEEHYSAHMVEHIEYVYGDLDLDIKPISEIESYHFVLQKDATRYEILISIHDTEHEELISVACLNLNVACQTSLRGNIAYKLEEKGLGKIDANNIHLAIKAVLREEEIV